MSTMRKMIRIALGVAICLALLNLVTARRIPFDKIDLTDKPPNAAIGGALIFIVLPLILMQLRLRPSGRYLTRRRKRSLCESGTYIV